MSTHLVGILICVAVCMAVNALNNVAGSYISHVGTKPGSLRGRRTLSMALSAIPLAAVAVACVLLASKNARKTPQPEGPVETAEHPQTIPITQREREVISLMATGLANKEIADRLCISSLTVKNHVYNIYQKTGVKSRVQMLRYFMSA